MYHYYYYSHYQKYKLGSTLFISIVHALKLCLIENILVPVLKRMVQKLQLSWLKIRQVLAIMDGPLVCIQKQWDIWGHQSGLTHLSLVCSPGSSGMFYVLYL